MTNPGPTRWTRAVNNAVAKPTSYGAKLLKKRLEIADNFSHSLNLRAVPKYWDDAVDHYLCSDFCTALDILRGTDTTTSDVNEKVVQIKDDLALDTVERTAGFYQRVFVTHRKITAKDLNRTVSCFVCGRKVAPSGGIDDTNQVNFKRARDAFNGVVPQVVHTTPEVIEKIVEVPVMERKNTYWVSQNGDVLAVQPTPWDEVELTAREVELLYLLPSAQRVAALKQIGAL